MPLGAPNMERWDIENAAEEILVGIARDGILASPQEDDLKRAEDYLPSFFGGRFPTLGLQVIRTFGESRYKDKPHLPEAVEVEVVLYDPCLPVRGAEHPQDDRTGSAKRRTRSLRGKFLSAIYDSKLGPNTTVIESRAGNRNEVGLALTDERGLDILWLDRTLLELRI